jgi:hypothetical protein
MAARPATRKALHAALDQVGNATTQFTNPEKVAQLRAHLATCHMVVDDLFDTVPAPRSTD